MGLYRWCERMWGGPYAFGIDFHIVYHSLCVVIKFARWRYHIEIRLEGRER